MRIAEEVIRSLERAPGEVILEVLLLELDRRKATELGVIPPEQARILSLGQIAPGQDLTELLRKLFATGIDISSLTPEQLAALLTSGVVPGFQIPPLIAFGGGRTIFFATLPGATASLRDFVSVTRDARRAILRAQDGRPAKLHVGDRYPIILASFTAIFFTPDIIKAILAGTFVPPIPAVQYEDLGLKLEATPYVHAGREVTLHLKIDLRSLTGVSLNGVPVLSNRTVEQQLRLRDGESTVLAGLVSRQVVRTREGTPGASQVLGERTTDYVETELILSVTPHIVRSPSRLPGASRGVYIGTEAHPINK
jgi:general secretion pathway protein D